MFHNLTNYGPEKEYNVVALTDDDGNVLDVVWHSHLEPQDDETGNSCEFIHRRPCGVSTYRVNDSLWWYEGLSLDEVRSTVLAAEAARVRRITTMSLKEEDIPTASESELRAEVYRLREAIEHALNRYNNELEHDDDTAPKPPCRICEIGDELADTIYA